MEGKQMKRIGLLLMMFAAVSAISCVQEEMPQTQDQGIFFTFEAAREDLTTKTVLVDNNKVEWVKNDKVGVYNGINETGKDVVSAVDTDGATFKAEVNSGLWMKSWEFAAQNAGAKGIFKASSADFDPNADVDEYLLFYPRSWNYFGRTDGDTKMIVSHSNTCSPE